MDIMQHPIWKNELFWQGVNLVMWLCLIGIVYLSQQDAAFYCQNYCEARGGEFRQYTPGSCTCRSTSPNIELPDIFLKINHTGNISLLTDNTKI